jgi:hypothetical protein
VQENVNISRELNNLERMKHSGALSDLEFTQAKQALLSSNNMQEAYLESLRVKTALNHLDTNWQYEQDQYKVVGRYGIRYLPTRLNSIMLGAMPTIGAMVIIYVCLSPTSNLALNNPMRSIGPFIGVAMIVYSLWKAQMHYKIALAYEKAKTHYNAERIRLRYQKK